MPLSRGRAVLSTTTAQTWGFRASITVKTANFAAFMVRLVYMTNVLS
jgi:hypothetical protein